MASKIYAKLTTLKPSAMATVAERRFGDAEALCSTGHNARANGVVYLAGFVIEILLKARLVEKFPSVARKRQHQVLGAEVEVWRLIWRQHDLEGMLLQMPSLEAGLDERSTRDGVQYLSFLKEICATWTIQARYSPHSILMSEAVEMLERVRILKEALR